jgi:hypothetical protein
MTSFDTPKTAAQFVETMLRSSIEADRLVSEHINNRDLCDAHTHDCVNAFIAAFAFHELRRTNPEAAEQLAEHLDHILTAGDIGGPAWRAPKALGHDPDQWIAEFNERAARRGAKTA